MLQIPWDSITVKTIIPNRSLIRYLLENYYGENIRYQGNEFTSSHWRYYTDKFDVQVDGDGNLVSLSGIAFGAFMWRGMGHRFLDQLCILSHLARLPRRRELLRLWAIAATVCNAMGLDLTLDVFRQVCSLELLKRNLADDWDNQRVHVLMIGDGYGVLSAIFKTVFPNSSIAMVDIGRTLLFQAHYCQLAHPGRIHELSGRIDNLDNADFVYCPAEELESLESYKFDIAVSIASMQEMNISTIARYFAFLRQRLQPSNLFYCCNRQSKTLVGGEVSEFMEYPWLEKDRYLVDEYCPWHQYFFSRGRSKNGLSIFGRRVPFVNFYDGKHLHRLAILATDR